MIFAINKEATYRGHKDSVYDLAPPVAGGKFISASGDGLVVQWNSPDEGKPLVKVNNPIYAIEHLITQDRLWVGENSEGIHLIDTANKKEIGSLKLPKVSVFFIKTVGSKTFVGNSIGFIHVIDSSSLQFNHHIHGSDKSARSVAIHQDNNEMAVGFSDHLIRIYDLNTYQLKHTIQAHTNSVFTLQYHQNFLISSGRDAHIKIWDASLNYILAEDIPAHNYAINQILTLENTNLLASCSMDKSIKIWNVDNMQLLKVIDKGKFASHGTSVNKLWWDKETKRLFSGSDDRTISEWKLF